ncbi:hypothetical protein K490DRAFT_68994 [Saccharata proteae CBS 121410]|uniref:Uncharacterized protein n=1 Tax=Saccharata proteae CBS 121410 TaxID=1314787 RepID=A0A9P4LS55_9PEZI|nr:hypothetical protein K490DRAFT_68994 [Saccharata proteae CBS 121410]
MSDTNSPPRSPHPSDRRRSSFAGQFVDLFGRQSSGSASASAMASQQAPPSGPITAAAAEANRRRLSLTTLGLSGSPNQPSPFNNNPRSRGESMSSVTTDSVDESPFEEDGAPGPSTSPSQGSPFARRFSFGARALRDVKQGHGSGNANGRSHPNARSSPPTAVKRRGLSISPSQHQFPHQHLPFLSCQALFSPIGSLPYAPLAHGFDFAENMRTRAQRTSSISVGPPPPSTHHRAKSVAVMEPPVREVPKPAKAPDAFQERILKGDFYMD